ncbi:MAG TPA: ELWxxDGT repeat protein [Thermoanaerobaculia bacterium]|nr:ELWxxDGT repeat protein [Thermoanaerobaculia bacterium]
MRSGLVRVLCFCFFLAPLAAGAQPAFQVKDINTTVPAATPLTGHWAEAGGVVYFTVSDGIHGAELWRSDGTAAGTRLVKDLCPGICSSSPVSLTALGDRIFFRMGDPNGSTSESFTQLWTSDGTAEGTVPFFNGFIHEPLIAAGPFLFFAKSDPGETGRELWRTDGTVAGTVLVKDILPGQLGSNVQLLGAIGSTVYFNAYFELTGKELGKSDGTEAGTVPVRPGEPKISFSSAAVSGNRIFLLTSNQGVGSELWVSDGSAGGTIRLATGLSSVLNLIAFDGGLVFTDESFSDTDLWASDGTVAGTLKIQDLNSCSCSFRYQRDYLSTGDQVFFSYQSAASGNELWTTDGTEAGTVPVADINPGAEDAIDRWGPAFTALGGKLLFFADDGTHGPEVWTSDGTAAGTALVADLEPGATGSSGELGNDAPLRVQRGIVAAGKWLFLARTTSDGWALWKTDGTAAGTELVLPIQTQTSSLAIREAGHDGKIGAGLGDLLLFRADDGMVGTELWKSDGSEAGTSLVADLNASSSSRPRQLTVMGNKVYFAADVQSVQLWKSDGTEAGTEEVFTAGSFPDHLTPLGNTLFFSMGRGLDGIHLHRTEDGPSGFTGPVGSWGPGSPRSNPKELTVFGSSLLFSAEGDELWKADSPWTDPVPFDIHPAGKHLANANGLTVVGSTLFFVADDGATGVELWKTDGTAAGTAQVRDILPGPASSIWNYSYMVAAGGLLFFDAADRQLWRSDGTAAGTFPLTNVVTGPPSYGVFRLTAAFDRLYFIADDGIHGQELWTSDGTVPGTRMVEDINPGPGSSSLQELEYVRHTLLFTADDGTHGLEPWVSDGTAATTFLLQDIAPGALPSSPGDFTAAGPLLYFGANDGTHGFEPWALTKTAVGSSFADVTRAHWAWSQVEALATAGITLGCAPERYCPAGTVTRAEMAVFLGRAIHGGSFVPPPATGTRFQDVPAGHWAAAWIEQIATDGVTQGCSASPPLFCIGSSVTRAEMAIFLLRALHSGSYTPPPATGTRFTDVPASHWAAAWIEQLAAEGITQGCAVNSYCPGNLVSRAEMAVFLTRTFWLTTP